MKHIMGHTKTYLLFSLLIYGLGNSQNSIPYFPQEQLIFETCSDSTDKNACLYDFLKKRTLGVLMEKKSQKLLSKLKQDTVVVKGSFVVDVNGNIREESQGFSINNKILKKKLDSDLTGILMNVPKLKVLYRKPEDIKSKHFFTYRFLTTKADNVTQFQYLPNKRKYTGGVIEETPVFPGCEGLSDKENRLCFQFAMQQHIESNFHYPLEAVRKRISGKVYIVFMISKEGKITKLRTRGPHTLLEQEAKRIVGLLPSITPGKQNGKPVDVPFSIPITFKL